MGARLSLGLGLNESEAFPSEALGNMYIAHIPQTIKPSLVPKPTLKIQRAILTLIIGKFSVCT